MDCSLPGSSVHGISHRKILELAAIPTPNVCIKILEKAMAPHSSTPAWKTPWMEEPGRLQSMGSIRETTEWLHFHFSLSCIGEGNGNPLQCSCLENPRDGGTWWAAVYGVAQSRTRLKWLSSSSSKLKANDLGGILWEIFTLLWKDKSREVLLSYSKQNWEIALSTSINYRTKLMSLIWIWLVLQFLVECINVLWFYTCKRAIITGLSCKLQ